MESGVRRTCWRGLLLCITGDGVSETKTLLVEEVGTEEEGDNDGS